jgi:hypothetical protein
VVKAVPWSPSAPVMAMPPGMSGMVGMTAEKAAAAKN